MQLIIHRYLLREIGVTFLGVTLVLLLLFLSATFVRILAEAMAGDYPAKVVFTLFALKGIANMVLILPVALFLGVMLALGRLYKDSEMVAMTACGIGPSYVLQSVAALALVVTLIIAYLSLWFAPYAEEKSHQLLDEVGAEVELEMVVPGRFIEVGEGHEVIYAESRDEDGELHGVFAYGMVDGEMAMLTAKRARQVGNSGDDNRYLMLYDGYRYEGRPGSKAYRRIQFKEHGLRIQEQQVVPSKRRRNAVPTATLFHSKDRADIAELQWRIATPLSTLILALLAVPLSRATPRQGRFGKLFLGIVLFVVYNNMLSVARSALSGGSVSPWVGTWWVHLLMVALVYILYRQHNRIRGPRRAR